MDGGKSGRPGGKACLVGFWGLGLIVIFDSGAPRRRTRKIRLVLGWVGKGSARCSCAPLLLTLPSRLGIFRCPGAARSPRGLAPLCAQVMQLWRVPHYLVFR